MQYKYECIHCGNRLRELYKQYSVSVLKVLECEKCNNIADKYIEYDLVIVMIDLVLLKKQAYRHILYNTNFKNHWKLGVVLLLVETHYEWSRHKQLNAANLEESSGIIFEGEKHFYLKCLEVILCHLLFLCVVIGSTLCLWASFPQMKPPNFKLRTLWRALILSNFCKFLLITEVIWGSIGHSSHILFVISYTFLSLIQAHSVVCRTSKFISICIVILGMCTMLLTKQFIEFG